MYTHKIVLLALCQFTLTVASPGRNLLRYILEPDKAFQTPLERRRYLLPV